MPIIVQHGGDGWSEGLLGGLAAAAGVVKGQRELEQEQEDRRQQLELFSLKRQEAKLSLAEMTRENEEAEARQTAEQIRVEQKRRQVLAERDEAVGNQPQSVQGTVGDRSSAFVPADDVRDDQWWAEFPLMDTPEDQRLMLEEAGHLQNMADLELDALGLQDRLKHFQRWAKNTGFEAEVGEFVAEQINLLEQATPSKNESLKLRPERGQPSPGRAAFNKLYTAFQEMRAEIRREVKRAEDLPALKAQQAAQRQANREAALEHEELIPWMESEAKRLDLQMENVLEGEVEPGIYLSPDPARDQTDRQTVAERDAAMAQMAQQQAIEAARVEQENELFATIGRKEMDKDARPLSELSEQERATMVEKAALYIAGGGDPRNLVGLKIDFASEEEKEAFKAEVNAAMRDQGEVIFLGGREARGEWLEAGLNAQAAQQAAQHEGVQGPTGPIGPGGETIPPAPDAAEPAEEEPARGRLLEIHTLGRGGARGETDPQAEVEPQGRGEQVQAEEEMRDHARRRAEEAGYPAKVAAKAEEADYDYDNARAAGLKPNAKGRWPSRVPNGPNEGLILKDVSHPTFKKTVKDDLDLGYRFYAKGGRLWSFSKKPGDEFQLLHDWRDIAEFVRQIESGPGPSPPLPRGPSPLPAPRGGGIE